VALASGEQQQRQLSTLLVGGQHGAPGAIGVGM
jgi:hypothetical protein